VNIINRLASAARSLGALLVQPAFAHCDTEDGPAVQDGHRALETGNVNYALKWVFLEGEREVRAAYDAAQASRAGGQAATADRHFLETLVRVHRQGEGAGYEGIKPTGTELPPEVAAADAALETGTIDPLRGLIAEDRWDELEKRFNIALGKKDFDIDDLTAARDYVAAYVSYFKYAEGEDEHHHHGGHDHGHHH
jgi:hypothetical protein